MPAGRRLAFDPASRRVWRICTGCGHWNLLGLDSSNAAATELTKRLVPTPGVSTVHERIGAVDVLTIASAAAPVVPREGLQTRRFLGARFPWGGILRARPIAYMPLMLLYFYIQDPASRTAGTWQSLGTFLLGFALAEDVKRFVLRQRRRRLGLAGRLLAFSALAFAVPPLVSATWFGTNFTILMVDFYIVGFAAADLFIPFHLATATSGKSVLLSKMILRNATLAAAPSDPGIAWSNLRGNQRVEGKAAAKMVATLGADLIGRASPPNVEHGWTLARMHGDLGGLMRVLDEVRPDSAGAHHWDDLPVAWQVALNIAAVEAIGSPRDRAKIQKKIADSSELAAIAESLD